MGYSQTGLLADPEFRKAKARHAARSRNTPDHYIAKLVDAAPTLTPPQRARLAALLTPLSNRDGGELP